MSGSGRKKTPLVAEKRFSGASASAAAPKKPKAPRKTRKTRAKRPAPKGVLGWVARIVRFFMRVIWGVTWRMGAVVALIVAGAVGYFYTTLPENVSALLDARTRGSVTMLDRDGKVYAWRGETYGGKITVDNISPHLQNAIIATEDKRFYKHFGVSPRGIASAIAINLREGRGPLSGHGGSTLTQQTAKLLCLGIPYDEQAWESEAAYEADCRETTLWRKVKEMIYSMALEVRYTKDEVLAIYLNRAYLGASSRGFAAASQRYFGIPASELNPAQSAMLAGLLVAPTRYAPTSDLERSQARAATVLKLMQEQGYISAAEREQYTANPATLSQAAQARAGGYFADWVMDTGPDFLTKDTTEDVVLKTTLDQRIQKAAEEAMKVIFETKVKAGSTAQAAVVVMSADGAVRAMVGGRQTQVTGAFNRATMAKRQTGSSFKPFVYAAALDLGYTPNATVVDEPITINVPGSGPYSPKNYDRKFHGRVTLTEALANSYNIPAVKVSEAVGRENVRNIAEDFGIESDLAAGPALALGASESSLLEMTGAYAGILNGGTSVTPYGILELRIKGDDEVLMGQGGGLGERVITEEAAKYLVYMMSQTIEAGTGRRADIGRPAAGKTGTTNSARDAWFLGFTADYVVGVWMGYDDNTPLTGVTGGGLPADIWREVMVRVNEGLPVRELPMLVPQRAQPQVSQSQPPEQTAREQTEAERRAAERARRQAEREVERQQRQQRRRQSGDVAERILEDVLCGLLGCR
ncbi:transglycosylase domain-containing protein [Vannielia litorea]|uniref:peptidoglycan glycosyltransferase n=1 Tax=Vannielia litorea TaxID=1217970 RepID=A0A1N6H834_9RHOB|nr:transglycosylase domain-containing protein [Vannielia litorea]SIO15827.1 penicillin-binding protein, 1A family [Vannielia litorea]